MSAVRALVPVGTVVDALSSSIERLAAELLPLGKREGNDWVEASSKHGGLGDGLRVCIRGSKAGIWRHFGQDVGGDGLDLVAWLLFRGDKKEAYRWALNWTGLGTADVAQLERARRTADASRAAARARAEADAEQAAASAFRLWLSAEPRIAGTPVEYYLAGRGIDLAALGRQPRAIRYHPELWCAEAGTKLPAMVTRIDGAGGQAVALHRTFLRQTGPHEWGKAALEYPKKVKGSFKGGAIRLWRGASGKPINEAPAGEIVDVTEGIEDGLSVVMADPDCRVIAAVSIDNMGNLVLPEQLRTVRLWRQNDTHPATIAAFDRAANKLINRGYDVLIPPLPADVKDVNELLTRGVA